jgi:hypothetical protein
LPLPIQSIFPGALENAYRRELQNLMDKNAVSRLWAKDISLWPVEEHQAESVSSNLGWLDLPDQLEPLMARVLSRAAEIEPAGFEDVVFIATGDSSLAAEATLRLPGAKLGKRSFLLDTIDPDTIHALEEQLHLERALFIFANKSGKSIETHTLLLYFLHKLASLGIDSPGRHFVALAEGDSYLAGHARSYGFADAFFDPAGILGRYSSLIHFNFFLAAVGHFEPQDLLARGRSMRDACGPSAPDGGNPALALAALIAAGEIEGFHRLVLLGPDSLDPFAYRIARLVGASLGKRGRGIIPIVGRASYGFDLLGRKSLVAILKMGGEELAELAKKCDELHAANVPLVAIELNGPGDLGVELFKWEIAAALSCVPLQSNPFDGPDFRESRTKAIQILDQMTKSQQVPSPTVRVKEGHIELSVEGETRQQISTLNMTEALRTFLSLRDPDGYLALIPFLGRGAQLRVILQGIRNRLESALSIPVLIMPGPRRLDGLGQICKSSPPVGLFILLTANPVTDIGVPGAGYSFGQLQLALAIAEFESLGRNERPVIRLHLARGAEQGLIQLESLFAGALGKGRTAVP